VTRAAIVVLSGLVAAAGCGGKSTFGLTSDDNNRAALGKALALRTLPPQPGPKNATGKPVVVAALSGQPRRLVAHDLAAGATLWAVDADVQSRIEIGGDFVVCREGEAVVARNLSDGAVRWRYALAGELGGVTADADRAYVVVARRRGERPLWTLTALDGRTGAATWSETSPGALGRPAAQGGIVMTPFLKQWLAILDARTGDPITRIRGVDEEIGFVETTSDAAWFGSRAGVFRLDGHAAAGTRAEASYGSVKLPPQLARATWAADGFDPVQAAYSASDRTRILWRGDAAGDGAILFQDGVVAVHYFRFVFGYSTRGELRWAYSHPRVELVASAHLGAVVAGVSAQGEIIAIDPASGALRHVGALADKAQVLGASFDADGWSPRAADLEQTSTVAALVAIARDRDARFAEVKELAVSALASLPGRDVSLELLRMIQHPRTAVKLRDTAAQVLVERRDATALDAYAAALAVRTDVIAGTAPVAVGELARVIAGLGATELDPAVRHQAVSALIVQLESPATSNAELIEVVRALAAIGDGAERTALRRQLLAYRADPAFGGDVELVHAVVDALLAHASVEDREVLGFVGEDPRTHAAVAAYVKQVLATD
jgi:outer membrane protein assembly factor BamB